MKRLPKILSRIAGTLVALAGLGWAGLQVTPANFPTPTAPTQNRGTVAVPPDLPAPVRRYFAVAFNNQVPRVDSLITWGRARANFGIWMPLRFQLYHRPGQAFQRKMEVTWFGLPVLKALDQYLDGKGMTGPVNQLATGPKVDQGANLILWAEATFYPSLLLTDPRIRWEAIDEHSARLLLPFGETQEEMIFYFDPATGLVSRTWAMRYQNNAGEKEPWFAEIQSWQTIDGMQIPARVAVTWEKAGSPWSYWDFEGVRWNVAIDDVLPAYSAAIVAP
jgi:hypothetical protein